jgi:hypothetical protein
MKSKCGRHLSYSIPTACGDFFVRDSFSEEFFGAVGILLEVESLTSVLLTMCPKLVPDGHMVETLVHDSNRRNRVSAHKRWRRNGLDVLIAVDRRPTTFSSRFLPFKRKKSGATGAKQQSLTHEQENSAHEPGILSHEVKTLLTTS